MEHPLSAEMRQAGLRIAVISDPRWPWRWHQWLIDALVLAGHRVRACPSGRAAMMPATLRLLLGFERLLYRAGGERACDLLSAAEVKAVPRIASIDSTECDLVIDLAGSARPGEVGCRLLRPLYDGVTGDAALIDRLMDARTVYLSIDDTALDKPARLGLSAIEQPEILARGLDNAYSRMAGSLLRHVERVVSGGEQATAGLTGMLSGESPVRPVRSRVAGFVCSNLACKIGNRLRRLASGGPRWGVGWRLAGADSVRNGCKLDVAAYHKLPDDGQRFYADPFVIRRGGLYHVFVEDFSFATAQGVISHFTISDAGEVSRPRMVLSRPYHLSYPCVFEHAGEVWMIPETSSKRTVELYRAQSFPDLWTREAVLVEGMAVEDATPVQHNGKWWLFGAVSDWQSSRWDALGLFHSDDLVGEWRAHSRNPVLLDARAARPAGAMFRRDGALWRPVQHSTTGYGGGLALARVERLDEAGYAQQVAERFGADDEAGLTGLHTLNEHEGLEVIDFYGKW
jgi:hypothetical protein